MAKVNFNGKTIEFDENNLRQLSDEELDSATGGYICPSDGLLVVYRYICYKCGAKGPWATIEDLHNPKVCNITHNDPACRGHIDSEPHTILLI
jgi:hypothetical protein